MNETKEILEAISELQRRKRLLLTEYTEVKKQADDLMSELIDVDNTIIDFCKQLGIYYEENGAESLATHYYAMARKYEDGR